jgi:hypothetical protein
VVLRPLAGVVEAAAAGAAGVGRDAAGAASGRGAGDRAGAESGHGNEIALRYTRGGFGTPYFADDRQIRVDGAEIVHERGGEERRAPLTSLREAGELLEDLVDAAALDEEPLRIDSAAARSLGEWFAFGTLVVAEVRARAGDGLDASNLNLWPEHFDVAAELGSEAAGQRADYGASPGDDEHPDPYLYVAPWTARPEGELWNAGHSPAPR